MKSKTVITSALALIGILLIGGVALYSQQGSVTMQTGTDTTTGMPAAAPEQTGQTTGATGNMSGTTGTPAVSQYKDGTYSATGKYISPGGNQTVSVTVTLKNDLVTDVTVVNGASDHESRQWQNRFISGITQVVLGKNIDSLNVRVVSGSSLTQGGFNDALAQIKAQARA